MVDCRSKELVTPDGLKFPLSKVQVFWIFGLPCGGKPLPNVVEGEQMEAEVKCLWDDYGSETGSGTREIKGQTIEEAVECNAVSEMEFKRAFLMFALNEILCPTTCYRLSIKLLPAVTVYHAAKDYDWCSLVLDHLLFYLRAFGKKFSEDGFVKGCGGCTFFLAVMYLDRLKRGPLNWGVIPRDRAWTRKEVWLAKMEDQIPNGDYGRLGCYDIAYGEPHPKAARDALPSSSGQPIPDPTSHQYYTGPPSRYKRKKRDKQTNGNPYLRKLEKRRREAEGVEQEQTNPTTKKPRIRNSPRTKGLHSKRARADAAVQPDQLAPGRTRWNLRSSKRPAFNNSHAAGVSSNSPAHNSPAASRPSPSVGAGVGEQAVRTSEPEGINCNQSTQTATINAVIEDLCSTFAMDEAELLSTLAPGTSSYAWGKGQANQEPDSVTSTSMSSDTSFVSYSTCEEGSDDEVVENVNILLFPPGFEYPLKNSFLPMDLSSNQQTNADGCQPNTQAGPVGCKETLLRNGGNDLPNEATVSKGQTGQLVVKEVTCGKEATNSAVSESSRRKKVIRSTMKFSRTYLKAWRPNLRLSQK